MSYIVFDLEWNQCPYGKEKEVASIPFEIIEIGAVKLDQDLKILDTFHRLIKPTVYKKMHFRTKEIIRMDMEELESGLPFHQAMEDFLIWGGEEVEYCTWGALDLTELQRNMKYYHLLDMIKGPIPYYDIQKIFGIEFEKKKTSRSLEWAVDYLKIEKNNGFHHALDDAYYTALVMQKLDRDILEAYYSIDCYQNPKTKKEEIEVVFPDYSKYISREFNSKEEAMKDRKVLNTKCYVCRKNLKRRVKWFSVNTKNHFSLSYCPKHGFLKGKIRMKRTDEGKYYVVKTLKLVGEEEAMRIQAKQEMLRLKRQLKRQKGKI